MPNLLHGYGSSKHLHELVAENTQRGVFIGHGNGSESGIDATTV
jgi:hypothetical protein